MRIFCMKMLLALLPVLCFSQNLVLNPSFEQTAFCPKGIGQFRNNVAMWTLPTGGTSDLFATCGVRDAGVPANAFGYQEPKFGANYAGLYMILIGDMREYVQGQLSGPLQKGQRYTISFWVSLAEHSDHAVNSFAVLLSQHPVGIRTTGFIKPSEVAASDAGVHQLVAIPGPGVLSDKKVWTKIEATFTAIGS